MRDRLMAETKAALKAQDKAAPVGAAPDQLQRCSSAISPPRPPSRTRKSRRCCRR